MSLLLGAFLGCLSAPQAEGDPGAKWKVDFKLSVRQDGDEWVFEIRGTTNIPPEAVLRARIYALEIVEDPIRGGRREDEEPLVWEDDGAQPSYRILTVDGGRFREEVYRFTREPWSLQYRARVHYMPRHQDSDAVLKSVSEHEFSKHADARFGTPEKFAVQMKGAVKEVMQDLITLETMYKDVTKRIERERGKFDPVDWKVWKAAFNERIERLEGLNEERYNLWAVWMEKQARMRVGGMCELLRRILIGSNEYLTGEKFETEGARKKYYERVQRLIDGFPPYLEECIDVLKLPLPLDPEKVDPIMTAYAKAFAPLRAWLEEGEGDRRAVRARARREGLSALMELIPILKNRKSAYRFANELSLRFRRLIDLVEQESAPETLKSALEAHDVALRDFKKFAGIK